MACALEAAIFRLTVALFWVMLLPAILNLPATGDTLKGLPSNMGLSPVPNLGKLTIPAMATFFLLGNCLSETVEANLMMIFSRRLGDNVKNRLVYAARNGREWRKHADIRIQAQGKAGQLSRPF